MIDSLDSFLFRDFDEPSVLRGDLSFFPETDRYLDLELKKIGNEFLLNFLPENSDKDLDKSEIFSLENNYLDFKNKIYNPSPSNNKITLNKGDNCNNTKKIDKNFNQNALIKNLEYANPYNYSSSEQNPEIGIKKKIKTIFFVIYPKKYSLFTKVNIKEELAEVNEKLEFINKKRRRNKEDDIRRMIGRRFFNDILYNKINDILIKEGSKLIFEKLQQDLIYDLVKKSNKHLLNKSLEHIFVTKELYKGKNMMKYFHNIKVLNLLKSEDYLEIRRRTQIDRILKMKYSDLFEEYLSSKEFVDEIARLKNNKEKFDKIYINNYIYYSLHFLENFSN